jgi:opacity protein-like surface antigen
MRNVFMPSFLACVCLAGILATPPPASAFDLTGFGGKLGYMSPENRDAALAVGAHMEFERIGTRVHLLPNVMYWKAGDLSDLSANADLYYHFASEGQLTPYVGAGLGVNFFSDDRSNQSDTKVGLNLIGGFRIPAPAVHYFLEGRYTASDISQFGLLGGITFHGWRAR